MDNVLVDFEAGLSKVSGDIKKEYAGRLDEIAARDEGRDKGRVHGHESSV